MEYLIYGIKENKQITPIRLNVGRCPLDGYLHLFESSDVGGLSKIRSERLITELDEQLEVISNRLDFPSAYLIYTDSEKEYKVVNSEPRDITEQPCVGDYMLVRGKEVKIEKITIDYQNKVTKVYTDYKIKDDTNYKESKEISNLEDKVREEAIYVLSEVSDYVKNNMQLLLNARDAYLPWRSYLGEFFKISTPTGEYKAVLTKVTNSKLIFSSYCHMKNRRKKIKVNLGVFNLEGDMFIKRIKL